MKSTLILAGLVAGGFAISTPETQPAVPTARVHYTGVRAEYQKRIYTYGQIDTELVLVNRHATKDVKIGDVVVFGRDGLKSTLAIHQGLRGKLLPPLAEIVLPIDAKLGLTAADPRVRGPKDVAKLVVGWDGPVDALRVTTIIKHREFTATNGFLGAVVAEGYDVMFN